MENGCTVDWGQGNIDLDPRFVDTVDIADYHLLDDSSCIDAGDPGFVAGPGETDIDGDPRILGGKIDIGADESPIPATVKITPKALNLASSGDWISCTIALPDGYDIDDIDTETIVLNGKINPAPTWSRTDEEANKLLVKFDRSEIQEMLKDVDGLVELSVSGTLTDDTEFKGTDTIRIVRGGSKK